MKEKSKASLWRDLPAFAWILLGVCILALISLTIVYFRKFGWSFPVDQEKWGQLGDFVGGILNPVIALCALFGIWYSVALQSRELAETRLALVEQASTAKQERAESRFFDLLKLYQDTIDELRFKRQEHVYEGKRAVHEFYKLYVRYYDRNAAPVSPSVDVWISKGVSSLREHSYLFDHYFRVLFNILSLSSKLLEHERYSYVKLLRAQLSRDELALIALNTLTEEGRPMIALIEEYGLLKHLEAHGLREKMIGILPATCFGRKFTAKKSCSSTSSTPSAPPNSPSR